MDFLILTIKTKYGDHEEGVAYLWVNSISRCKSAEGEDIIQYVISGTGQYVPVKDVLCITPSTPTPQQYQVFK